MESIWKREKGDEDRIVRRRVREEDGYGDKKMWKEDRERYKAEGEGVKGPRGEWKGGAKMKEGK